MPENHISFLEDKLSKTEFYFRGLDLQHRTPERGFLSCESEKNKFKDSQGKQTRTENKASFESKILIQKQHCASVAVNCRRGFVDSLKPGFHSIVIHHRSLAYNIGDALKQ